MPTRAFLVNGLGMDRRFGALLRPLPLVGDWSAASAEVAEILRFLSGVDAMLLSDRQVRLARGKPSLDRCIGDVASAGCNIEGVHVRRPNAPPSKENGEVGAPTWS